MKNTSLHGVVFAFALLAQLGAKADVIFNNFGPNDGFDPTQGFGVVWSVLSPGSGANVGQGVAARFTVGSQSYSLGSITLPLEHTQGTNNLAISILADSGGQPTGPVVETVVSHPLGISATPQVVTFTSSLTPVLAGGTAYWLVVAPPDFNTSDSQNNSVYAWWDSALTGVYARQYFNFQNNTWNPWQLTPSGLLPAFRIEGAPVPEPNAAPLSLVAAIALFVISRHKNSTNKRF